ncbi:MAG: DEAD/DEAH box helicase, partial [Anaerolineae bacterium]|nr:DEAD/DEAH box helicase [Anaerolineae bacterium]
DVYKRQALNMGMGNQEDDTGLPIVDIEASGDVKAFFDQLINADQIPLVDVPATLQANLRPYQQRGLSWLAFLRRYRLGACLADDMGLGKTMQMLALLLLTRTPAPATPVATADTPSAKSKKPRKNTGSVPPPLSAASKPSLLICPMSIVGNWQREAAKFAPSLNVMVHHGPDRLEGADFAAKAQRHDLVLSTYALAQRDEDTLKLVDWDTLVLDEAQNIKNIETKQTQAIRRIEADYRIALTGTPVENRLSELWSIMDFLNRGYLGKQNAFGSNFAQPIEKYRDEAKTKTLKKLIQPFVLRRLKTDKSIIADLPDKLEMKVMCNLVREQATLYEAVVKDMMQKIEQSEGPDRRFLVLATLMKLKQVCNHPAHFLKDGSAISGRSGKLVRLEEMLDEALSVGDKSLVFTQFAEMGELLQTHLQRRFGREVFFLHGGVVKSKRDEMVRRFQTEPKTSPIFLLSIKAGGVGLNLTAANHVFHFDRWWNPAVENQATDRAFRIGQQKNVQVHKYICIGTLEEKIDQLIDQKRELAENIVSADEGWISDLNNADLRDLFNLSKDAVGD